MGYLQVLQSLVRAYKIAKGTMPRGLDLLKMKMKARRKALDSKKIIQFPPGGKDKTNPFGIMEKVVNKKGKYVGRREPEAQMKIRMERQNREAAQRIRDKKKPRDDKANGGSPNLPFPGFLEGVRPGGMPLPSLDYYDDDAGVKGLMKKRKKKKKKREKKATGGMANISQTYDNNPTLQAQFPNKQDYLDLFGGIASTTVAQTPTPTMTEQATQSTVINPVKPILPIVPQGDGDGGGGSGPKGFDKGYSSANFDLGPNKAVVDYEAEAYGIGRTPLGTASQIITGIPSISKTAFQFVKRAGESLRDRFEKSANAKREADRIAAEQEKARIADEIARQMNRVYYDNSGADFTGGRYDGAASRSDYESNPTGFSGSS